MKRAGWEEWWLEGEMMPCLDGIEARGRDGDDPGYIMDGLAGPVELGV